jgi:hypothetical protein
MGSFSGHVLSESGGDDCECHYEHDDCYHPLMRDDDDIGDQNSAHSDDTSSPCRRPIRRPRTVA